MPVSSTPSYRSMHESSQNSSQINGEIPGTLDYPILGETLSKLSELNGIKRTRYDISGSEIEYRIGASIAGEGCAGGGGGRGGGGCGPVVAETGTLFREFGFKEPPAHLFGSINKDTYPTMTRAVKEKPEGIGESLSWLKRELMDLRNTDQELTRTLFTLQSKIRDLKNKINQDEADDDCDCSEKSDFPTSWSSSGQRNDSFSSISGSPPTTNGINMIKEENEEEPVMEFKQVKQVHETITVTRSSVDEVMPSADFTTSKSAINGNSTHGATTATPTVNHNANGYSRNTNNSLDQIIKAPVSLRNGVTSGGLNNHSRIEKPIVPPPPVNKRKSLTDGLKNSIEKPIVPPPPVQKRKSLTSDGLNNSIDKPSVPPPPVNKRKSLTDSLKNSSEKPSLPPPPPPPMSTSPTPSLKSTSSSEVVHRFVMKEDSKRDSMSSSSFVSSSSSFTSSLEELRLQDVPRDLRSSGRSFDRMTFEEEDEEEEEHVMNQDELDSSVKSKDDVLSSSIKFSLFSFDDNGNEGKGSDESSEASRMMESIWAEATMFS